MAYDAIEPSGNVEPTYMLALLCATVVNTVSAIFAKKGSENKSISPDAFIPKWIEAVLPKEEEQKVEQTVDEQKAAILAIANMFKSSKKRISKPPPKYRRDAK